MTPFLVAAIGTFVVGCVVVPLDLALVTGLALTGVVAGVAGRDRAGAGRAGIGTVVGLAALFTVDLAGIAQTFWNVRWEDFSDPEYGGLLPAILLLVTVGLVTVALMGYVIGAAGARSSL